MLRGPGRIIEHELAGFFSEMRRVPRLRGVEIRERFDDMSISVIFRTDESSFSVRIDQRYFEGLTQQYWVIDSFRRYCEELYCHVANNFTRGCEAIGHRHYERMQTIEDEVSRSIHQTPPAYWLPPVIAEYGRELERVYGINPATERSMELLRRWLSKEQLEQFEADGHFIVVGNVTRHEYRIEQAHMFGVVRMKDQMSFCFVPQGALSIGDIMLAQKISLETDELAALRIANKRPYNVF